jgi:hypothetical protein
MTNEDIIRMAREAGLYSGSPRTPSTGRMIEKRLERFAALVAAHTLSNIDPSKFMSYQEAYEAGQFAEREACAKLCESINDGTPYNQAEECAAAIRARGQA